MLRVAAAFSRYFDVAQKEAISFARSAGLLWEQIADSLGQSSQALWQRGEREARHCRLCSKQVRSVGGGDSSRSVIVVRKDEVISGGQSSTHSAAPTPGRLAVRGLVTFCFEPASLEVPIHVQTSEAGD